MRTLRKNSAKTLAENEVVLLRRKERPGIHYAPVLTTLVRGDKLALPDKRDGFIYADDIIGRTPRSLARTANGKIEFRLHEPSLGEYTNLSPRIVTPVSCCQACSFSIQFHDDTKLFCHYRRLPYGYNSSLRAYLNSPATTPPLSSLCRTMLIARQ